MKLVDARRVAQRASRGSAFRAIRIFLFPAAVFDSRSTSTRLARESPTSKPAIA